MKIVVFGGQGTIGKAVVEELGSRHEIVIVGRSSGAYQADMRDFAAVKTTLAKIGRFDALIAVAGSGHVGDLSEMQPENILSSLQDKLMGQINLVLAGQHLINSGGSFTLTSGILSREPIPLFSAISAANGGLEAFARAAAIDLLPRALRINVVCPTVLTESMSKYGDYFRGFASVPARQVALAYSRSVEGGQTGQIYRVTPTAI